MHLLSLNLGGGFSVDSICHLRDRPGFAIQRTFDELFSNAPHFADALRIGLVNRFCEHNSQLMLPISLSWACFLSLGCCWCWCGSWPDVKISPPVLRARLAIAKGLAMNPFMPANFVSVGHRCCGQ